MSGGGGGWVGWGGCVCVCGGGGGALRMLGPAAHAGVSSSWWGVGGWVGWGGWGRAGGGKRGMPVARRVLAPRHYCSWGGAMRVGIHGRRE